MSNEWIGFMKGMLSQPKMSTEWNHWLVTLCPFMIPRNLDGSIPEDYDYTQTWLDFIPEGWAWAFGEEFALQLHGILERYFYEEDETFETDNFYIRDMKEKWGCLRVSYAGIEKYPELCKKVDAFLYEWEANSEHTCVNCGVQDVNLKSINGWIMPICSECEEVYGK